MIIFQLSAAQGPAECCLAVANAYKVFLQEANTLKLAVQVLEEEYGVVPHTYKSIVLSVEGNGALEYVERWNGTIQWRNKSPFRPKHKRKNWFLTASYSLHEERVLKNEFKFESCRSSGPGGQHANKTNSAVRATHVSSGIEVKVQSERSQHANKRLAIALIERKLKLKEDLELEDQKSTRHKSHHFIERGNAVRVFIGDKFIDEVV